MRFSDQESIATGKVVFRWGDLSPATHNEKGEPSWCICCGDSRIPHRHCFGKFIKLDDHPDSVFLGLKVEDVYDFINEALNRMKNIEGKRVKISLEVIK